MDLDGLIGAMEKDGLNRRIPSAASQQADRSLVAQRTPRQHSCTLYSVFGFESTVMGLSPPVKLTSGLERVAKFSPERLIDTFRKL